LLRTDLLAALESRELRFFSSLHVPSINSWQHFSFARIYSSELPMLAGLNKPSLKDRQTQNLDSNKKP